MFRKHRGLVIQEFPSIIRCEIWEMYWLFDEDVYNNHGDIDGNKKALLKREIKKWSFLLRWAIRLGSRSPYLLLLCMSTPLERKNEGRGQNSFHLRWSKITFQLLEYAHCINIQCSEWHCAVNSSPAFCDKGPPITAMRWYTALSLSVSKYVLRGHA